MRVQKNSRERIPIGSRAALNAFFKSNPKAFFVYQKRILQILGRKPLSFTLCFTRNEPNEQTQRNLVSLFTSSGFVFSGYSTQPSGTIEMSFERLAPYVPRLNYSQKTQLSLFQKALGSNNPFTKRLLAIVYRKRFAKAASFDIVFERFRPDVVIKFNSFVETLGYTVSADPNNAAIFHYRLAKRKK